MSATHATTGVPVWIITVVHVLFVLFFLSLVFWPNCTLPYVVWVPFLLSVVWVVFDGCPLTRIDPALDDQVFMQVLARPFVGNVSNNTMAALTISTLLLVTAVVGIRMHFKWPY